VDSALAGGGDPFATGAVAMAPGAAYALSAYRNIKEFEWDVVLNPKGPKGSFSVITTDSLSIYRGAKAPEAAWAFIQECLTEDAAKLYCQEFKGPIPALKAGQKYFLLPGQPPEHQQYLVDAVKSARPPMQSPYSAPVTLPFQKALAAAFSGSKTLDQVMNETCPALATGLQEEIDRVKSYSG
jgi:ABC-type glycerol-3-phosphate transport system substrate-binding protein